MAKQYTHMIRLGIGLELTKLLSPKNIPGVKAYLGIDNDAELVNAIAQDQYSKIKKALQGTGLEIIEADFDQIQQSDNSENPTSTEPVVEKLASETNEEDKHKSESSKSTINEIDYDVNAYLLDQLKPILEKAKNGNLEITTITINGNYVVYLVTPDELKELAGLDDDVEIDFDELDANQLAIINFVDRKENMTFEIIKEKETEKVLDGKN
ncbi:hypothetical protein [Limosilactobacillus reuteri]|uniref:hypothetical protein n=1 Tax=Limosilactobacillus reuteri TaxID=1598 RepID=UPI00081BCC59|nr:hypothetical protein [Limosilactobacillus reuteri]MCH5380239.1 hypothetical protein [Limosilactobacillus reuteri]OCW67412.1 hypothetical protein BBP13_09280 [Limosilactobacillus reuteri]OCW68421.1 hypothetical protein BBP14_08080 [Limosilactobacillus reuteri]